MRIVNMQSTVRYTRFGTLLLAWTLLGSITFARHLLLMCNSHERLLIGLAGWLTSFYPWAFLTLLVFRLEERFPLRRSAWFHNLTALALVGIPFVCLAHVMTVALSTALWRAVHESIMPLPTLWSISNCELMMQGMLYFSSVIGACILRNLIDLQESERRTAQLALERAELESSLRRAELATLRMRLNPHFLFNSLQNISTLIRHDPRIASKMLTRLGDLLRSSLGKGAEVETTLSAEIALTKAYVAMEEMRFSNRLSVLFELEPGLEQAVVPSFILQPLVENAMIHGLGGKQQTGQIKIGCLRRSGELVLTVTDNGIGLSKQNLEDLEMGIGLGSTCERLARMYSDQHTFSIHPLSEGGTEARIVLPLRMKDAPPEASLHEFTSFAHR
ncbi:histidine kinase [Granulicella sp. dw_53]|uniref:sensor histidine kinase n=1 Tax=Granulicella sp. dw_53 TaxID=2719792 RepID=UPI001BD42A7B|nr:histidine kinase [Granulicella sp. dw_53]